MHPSVTIVVVPRERFSHARASLETVYRNTDYPFDLVYVDGNSPPSLKSYLERAAAARGFQLIRTDWFLSPNQARNMGAKGVKAKYIVWLDNDADVEPGWLTHMVACAEETGAWVVSPIYFEGEDRMRMVHTAGGIVEFHDDANGVRTITVDHLFHEVPYEEARLKLRREPTGFCEFHCVLIRTEAFERLGPLDEECLSLHEHLDLSLSVRQAGGEVYVEPNAHVTYRYGLLDKYDVEYARVRWSDEWNRRSTVRFLRKYGMDETSPWGVSVIDFGRVHRQHLENLQRTPSRIAKTIASRVLPRRVYSALKEMRG